MKIKNFILVFVLICICANAQQKKYSERYIDAYKAYEDAVCPIEEDGIKHFVYFARDREVIVDHPFLDNPRFAGAQIMYIWRRLEPSKDKYDFTEIIDDYNYLKSKGKKLFIQLQDATFSNKYHPVPDYMTTAQYDGGEIHQYNDNDKPAGWVAKRWNPKVRERFAALLKALGNEFDGKIEGLNLQESAIGIANKYDSSFTPAIYTESLKKNMLAMKEAFPISTTMLYANFMPGEWLPKNDKGYLKSIYEYGEEIGVGLGGPDLMVHRKGQLNHTIAMMHENKFSVPLGIAIQDGNYVGETGTIKDVVIARKNIVPMLHAFAKDFLKVKYMFWVNQPPYFEEDVLPCFGTE